MTCIFCGEPAVGSIIARTNVPLAKGDTRDATRMAVLRMCETHIGGIHAVVRLFSDEAGMILDKGDWMPVKPKKVVKGAASE